MTLGQRPDFAEARALRQDWSIVDMFSSVRRGLVGLLFLLLLLDCRGISRVVCPIGGLEWARGSPATLGLDHARQRMEGGVATNFYKSRPSGSIGVYFLQQSYCAYFRSSLLFVLCGFGAELYPAGVRRHV